MDNPKNRAFADLEVLVCDDDSMVIRIIEHILREMGVNRVHSTRFPKTALQLLKEPAERPFDIFICDWMMPEMSGLEVLEKIRADDFDVAFVMLTGNTTEDAVGEAAKLGVEAYIGKPFTADQVQRKIATVARRVLKGRDG